MSVDIFNNNGIAEGNQSSSSGSCEEFYDRPSAPYRLANFYVMVAVTIFGLIGNMFVISVFSRVSKKRSSDVFLLTLAIYDILALLTISSYAHVSVYPYVFGSGDSHDFTFSTSLTVTVLPWDFIIRTGNTYIIVLVSVDRYIHACRPMYARTWCTKQRAVYQVLAVVIGSVLYNIPRFFEYYEIYDILEQTTDRCFGYFIFYPKGSPATDNVYIFLYCVAMHITVIYAIPLSILCYINFFLVKVIKERLRFGIGSQSARNIQEQEIRKHSKDKIIVTLVIVTIIFSVCQVPDMILQLLWRLPVIPPGTTDYSLFAHNLIIINSSINFLIYTFTYQRFKDKLRQFVLNPCRKRKVKETAVTGSKNEEWSNKTSSS